MGPTKPYIRILDEALTLIKEGRFSAAELLVSNFYHRYKRSAKDYMALLRMTLSHDGYINADDATKNQLAKILYLLDRLHNRSFYAIHVAHHKEAAPTGEIIRFSIEEKRTPAL